MRSRRPASSSPGARLSIGPDDAWRMVRCDSPDMPRPYETAGTDSGLDSHARARLRVAGVVDRTGAALARHGYVYPCGGDGARHNRPSGLMAPGTEPDIQRSHAIYRRSPPFAARPFPPPEIRSIGPRRWPPRLESPRGRRVASAALAFSVANLTANLIGSFFLGWLVARRERHSATGLAISFWGIGVLGSFTTFSGFSVAALDLMRTGRLPAAAGYVAASVIGGLFSARTGLRLGDRR